MDEIETAVNLKQLRTLVDHVDDSDNVFAHKTIKNAMLVIVEILHGLNERLLELQTMEDDDE